MTDDDAPWLAAAEPSQRKADRGPLLRIIVVLGVIAIVAVIAVFVLLRPGKGSDEGYMEPAQAPLITAEPGPYKIAPTDPRGLDVEGQDQTLYAAGSGIEASSDIDLGALPEEPMARPGTAPAVLPPARDLLPPAMRKPPEALKPAEAIKPAPASPPPAATPPAATPATATPPAAAPPSAQKAAAGRTVQLGAFSSRERAQAEWARLSAKHGMPGFAPRYASVSRDGQTLWRLRAAGGDAAALCARLAAAGDTCSVVTE